jgi:pimeloyl-ACP methyl ester carboxylesterase
MPFAENRGQRIHFTDEGSGPLVVLQHGFLSSADDWKRVGFVDRLTDAYRVVCIDSLAHGQSDKPTDPSLYALEQRAGDVIAVLDAVGEDRMHLLGYSMGGWIAGGVARHHPQRLASLTIAGWDCVNGPSKIAEMLGVVITGELLVQTARATAPDLIAWVTPDIEQAVITCGNALMAGPIPADAEIRALDVPILCWNGVADPYHQQMEPFAAANGYQYLATEGDHLGAMMLHAVTAANAYKDFLAKA